jgi:hypothetical protein
LVLLHCGNAVDDDLDGAVNDGCPPIVGADLVLAWPVERSAHYGPLIARGTLTDGTPIAVSSLRTTYGSELSSVRGFQHLNDPAYMASGFSAFRTAVASGIDYTFNWFYIDSRNIGYQHSCKCPQRAPGIDPYLPAWGNGAWDWQGFLAPANQPWDLNPPQGYLTSWNNKPAPQFAASDSNYSYGPVYRSLMLDTRIEAAIAGGPILRSDLIDAMADAMTVDLRGQEDLPLLLEALGTTAPGSGDPRAQAMRDRLAAWLAAETHRRDHDRDGVYDDPQAPAIMDAWWPRLVHAMFDTASGDAVNALGITIDDGDRRNHLGSAFNNGMYGHVNKDLRRVLGHAVADPWSRAYCGNGNLAACRAALWAAMSQAAADLQAEFGSANVADWRRAMADEDVRHTAAGITAVPAIHWINRPTFQQVVQIGADIDPFKCYKARGGAGAPSQVLTVSDELGARGVAVSKPQALCNAAAVNQQAVADPTAHLTCYQLKNVPGTPRFLRRTVEITNRFGAQTVTLLKPSSLCVPSAHDGAAAALPTDAVTCYRARRADAAQIVDVQDAFQNESTRVRKLASVCLPTDTGGGVIDRADRLACYTIRSVPGNPGSSSATSPSPTRSAIRR